MKIQVLESKTKDISDELLDENGYIKLFSSSYYEKFSWSEIRLFCHNYAKYCLVTKELIDTLKIFIDGKKTIELGSGCGDLGHHLKIPMTDNKIQEEDEVKKIYKSMCQPIIKYPKEVEKLEALEALDKYKPEVAISAWTTTFGNPTIEKYGCNERGFKEFEILKKVKTYILIGSEEIHGDKPIIKTVDHKKITHPGLLSRTKDKLLNRIWIFDNGN